MHGSRFAWFPIMLAFLIGCSRLPPDASPDGAVRLFLDGMEAAEATPARRATPTIYLDPPRGRTSKNARGARAGSKDVRCIPGTCSRWVDSASLFGQRRMHAKVVGDRASVEVLGADPQNERASVTCVREVGGWRIEPDLP